MKKARKAFWHNIRFKYKLSIVNENTLEEIVGIHVFEIERIVGIAGVVCGDILHSCSHNRLYAFAQLSARLHEQ